MTTREISEPAPPPGLLSKLKQVKIEGPKDFAAKLDLYLSGEKLLGLHAWASTTSK